jgi:hypothetical protein
MIHNLYISTYQPSNLDGSGLGKVKVYLPVQIVAIEKSTNSLSKVTFNQSIITLYEGLRPRTSINFSTNQEFLRNKGVPKQYLDWNIYQEIRSCVDMVSDYVLLEEKLQVGSYYKGSISRIKFENPQFVGHPQSVMYKVNGETKVYVNRTTSYIYSTADLATFGIQGEYTFHYFPRFVIKFNSNEFLLDTDFGKVTPNYGIFSYDVVKTDNDVWVSEDE